MKMADIRSHVGVAMDEQKGIKVRGTIKTIGEDEEDPSHVIVEIKIPAKGKKKESGYQEPSTFSYSIPKRLVKGLTIGDPIIITLTHG